MVGFPKSDDHISSHIQFSNFGFSQNLYRNDSKMDMKLAEIVELTSS